MEERLCSILATIISDHLVDDHRALIRTVNTEYDSLHGSETWKAMRSQQFGLLSKFFRENSRFNFHRVAAGRHMVSVSPDFKWQRTHSPDCQSLLDCQLHFVECNQCGKSGYPGKRYECSNCPSDGGSSYNLCETCFETRNTFHPTSHSFYEWATPSQVDRSVNIVWWPKEEAKEEEVVHDGIFCDFCHPDEILSSPATIEKDYIHGVRYSCSGCDFDLCEKHFEAHCSSSWRFGHDHTHANWIKRSRSSNSDDDDDNGEPITIPMIGIRPFEPGTFPLDCLGCIASYIDSPCIFLRLSLASRGVYSFLRGPDCTTPNQIVFRIDDANMNRACSIFCGPRGMAKIQPMSFVRVLELFVKKPLGEFCRRIQSLGDHEAAVDIFSCWSKVENLVVGTAPGPTGGFRLPDSILGCMSNLRVLRLVNGSFSNEGIAAVGATLEVLHLEGLGSSVTQAVLPSLPGLRELRLENVRFFGNRTSDADKYWGNLTRLEKLLCWNVNGLGDDVLRTCGSLLRKFEIRGCHSFGIAGFAHLSVIEDLKVDQCRRLSNKDEILRRMLPRKPESFEFVRRRRRRGGRMVARPRRPRPRGPPVRKVE